MQHASTVPYQLLYVLKYCGSSDSSRMKKAKCMSLWWMIQAHLGFLKIPLVYYLLLLKVWMDCYGSEDLIYQSVWSFMWHTALFTSLADLSILPKVANVAYGILFLIFYVSKRWAALPRAIIETGLMVLFKKRFYYPHHCLSSLLMLYKNAISTCCYLAFLYFIIAIVQLTFYF